MSPLHDRRASAKPPAVARSGADMNGAVWDGSFFSVPMRLESADGFTPPAVRLPAHPPGTRVRSSGVSFAAVAPPSPAAHSTTAQQPPRRMNRAASGPAEIQLAPLPESRRSTSAAVPGPGEDGAGLLAGDARGSPGRQRGSSYDSSPEISGDGGVRHHSNGSARGQTSAEASSARRQMAGNQPAVRRESDLIRFSEPGDGGAPSSAARDAGDLAAETDRLYTECEAGSGFIA